MAREVTSQVKVKEAEELAQALSEAISGRDGEEAARISMMLSDLSVPVSVSISPKAYPQDTIRLKVGVEDAQSDTYIPVTIDVSPHMTIAQLKDKISHDYGFHPTLQRWVIGKRLARDRESLFSHGVQQNGDQVFLFIMSAGAAHFTRHQQQLDQEQQRLENIMESIQLVPRGSVERVSEKKKIPSPPPQSKPQMGWSCGQCTYLNKPTRPGCEMCGGTRPEEYQVPNIYKPDLEESQRLREEELGMLQFQQSLAMERHRNFRSLLETDEKSLVVNSSDVDCPICMCTLQPGEGATLRDCLHSFCRECLKGTILHNQEPEVACPFFDDDYICESKLQDREIRALLTEEEHKKFLDMRLNIAESRSDHSFHCQTPNCPGWCIYEDEVNEFPCEICKETNCILCKAIHKGQNCKEYQDDLRIRAENDLAAKQTKLMLDALLQSGEAMHCPRCDVIVQKKDGCDWICCLMCKTEICWVTKQARWGPKGNGDTSRGCRCRVNNQLCHPNCHNCH